MCKVCNVPKEMKKTKIVKGNDKNKMVNHFNLQIYRKVKHTRTTKISFCALFVTAKSLGFGYP